MEWQFYTRTPLTAAQKNADAITDKNWIRWDIFSPFLQRTVEAADIWWAVTSCPTVTPHQCQLFMPSLLSNQHAEEAESCLAQWDPGTRICYSVNSWYWYCWWEFIYCFREAEKLTPKKRRVGKQLLPMAPICLWQNIILIVCITHLQEGAHLPFLGPRAGVCILVSTTSLVFGSLWSKVGWCQLQNFFSRRFLTLYSSLFIFFPISLCPPILGLLIPLHFLLSVLHMLSCSTRKSSA